MNEFTVLPKRLGKIRTGFKVSFVWYYHNSIEAWTAERWVRTIEEAEELIKNTIIDRSYAGYGMEPKPTSVSIQYVEEVDITHYFV